MNAAIALGTARMYPSSTFEAPRELMYKGQIGLTRFTDNELRRIIMNSTRMFLFCPTRFMGTAIYLSSFQIFERV
ncbi:MAG: hypothetical protein OEZ24_05335 [Candidatus Bathyarchaeota archaeon]|nr:hypothetical protein [Candidatus Bathyarchaeota archaeon]